ncbi:hypothetical protein E5F05_04465 (plasmid) [Deinococcus metallilatus]|uniref:Uncharacterized protein n=1 Tax=Deinococcus metallilatus TaxID=1211322 RepID=A0AAJ5JZI8_9DEIO|nr:hypothetical protein [Deinococcus metallilatus]MBB5293802.1 hypothetical protein [Deinococcus metallilatus]QBY07241.1 hypothetical protein E5F05_04465 [Deinococcus metallilatus]RXJ14713.1 hypothetical protein ERJ73_03195 [Deinococcus metallilatus]TLK30833.1 hypothetical protein FCS05_03510 [Deinococcus metallilatus]GMA17732.1 hypothetical protein GCM10025871_40630 [Deinococcus metallilatus]
MQIDQERLEALRPKLVNHGVDVEHLPPPDSEEWGALVRELNLKDPGLAQDFSGLRYDPDELLSSELVERQATRATARTGVLGWLKAPFQKKTVNGDKAPNTALVRNVLLGAGAVAAVAFYVLVPSGDKVSASRMAGQPPVVPANEGAVASPQTTPPVQSDAVPAPEDTVPTTPIQPSPDTPSVDARVDPTGLGVEDASTSAGPSAPAVNLTSGEEGTVPTVVGPPMPVGPTTLPSSPVAPAPHLSAPIVIRQTSPQRTRLQAHTPKDQVVQAPPTLSGSRDTSGSGTTGGEARPWALSGSAAQGTSGEASRRSGLSSANASAATATPEPGDSSSSARSGLSSTAAADPTPPRLVSLAAAQGGGVPVSTASGAQEQSDQRPSMAENRTQVLGLLSMQGSSTSEGTTSSGAGTSTASSYSLSGMTGTGDTALQGAAESAAAIPAAEAPAPYPVGRPLAAKLLVGALAVQDMAIGLPIYAETEDGATWRGTPQLDAQGRIQMTFDTVLQGNREYPLMADAYGPDGLPGVRTQVKPTAPNLVSSLMSGFFGGAKAFVDAMVNQRNVTVQTGVGGTGSVVTSSAANTPNFWMLTGAGALGSLQLPEGQASLVNVAELPKGTTLQIVVRRNSGGNGQ